ncbi:MAG: Na+/H+ antiporter subunit E [Burkholderiales bacterium]
MKRLFPYPLTSAVLAAGWLLLAGFSAAHVVLALVVAALLPHFTRHFVGEAMGRARGWRGLGRAVPFALLVTWDIVVANIAVARLVLGPPARLRPAYVEVPLALEQPLALSLLASIITMTPGTVSADLSDDRRRLLVHVLDTSDPDALVAQIKSRYERPLAEIFA